jgi:hypothetical protein
MRDPDVARNRTTEDQTTDHLEYSGTATGLAENVPAMPALGL